ncbi:MAG TPA: HEAT repeat domain-containing protein [Thermotogota bacterium]|nr:HEAT repeat domain-containing protein [Thermotogota bacterium]HRW91407.1 HEAT repeat domain-containing protein [Thermotogota bacterium]
MKRAVLLFLALAFVGGLFASSFHGISFEEWKTVLELGSPSEKKMALEALGNMIEPQAEQILLSYLEHPDLELRFSAVWSLGQLCSSQAATSIAWMMGEYQDVRIDGALVNIGFPAVPPLVLKLKLAYLMKEMEQGIRISRILVDIGDPEGLLEVATFLSNLLGDESYKGHASSMLSQIGEKAVEPLLIALRSTYNDEVKVNIIGTLVQIGDARILSDLYTLSSHPNPAIRRHVANALGRMPSPDNLPYLSSMLRDGDQSVRIQAIVALGEIKDPSSVSALMGLLTDMSPVIRAYSAYALGEIKDVRAVYPLIQLLNDESVLKTVDPRTGKSIEMAVAAFAVEALKKINDPRGLDELRRRGLLE